MAHDPLLAYTPCSNSYTQEQGSPRERAVGSMRFASKHVPDIQQTRLHRGLHRKIPIRQRGSGLWCPAYPLGNFVPSPRSTAFTPNNGRRSATNEGRDHEQVVKLGRGIIHT